ncbi:MAG: leucine-rich repeat domain-containing protein [Ruminococcus sp.]|nr:leucine-rich repeat domain-containing protein [Ruminococcus sp.]
MIVDKEYVVSFDETDVVDGKLTFPKGIKYCKTESSNIKSRKVKNSIREIDFADIERIDVSVKEFAPLVETVKGSKALVICSCSFTDCEKLNNIEIPNVKKIGEYSFLRCVSLTAIELWNTETIEAHAFIDSGLECVIFGEKLKYIGKSAFQHTKLETINTRNAKIENFAFMNCYNLQTVYMDSITKCKGWSFCQCDALSEIFIKKYDEYAVLPHINPGYEYSICEYDSNEIRHNIICGCNEQGIDEDIAEPAYEYLQKIDHPKRSSNLYVLKDGGFICCGKKGVSPKFSSIDEFKDYMDMEGS